MAGVPAALRVLHVAEAFGGGLLEVVVRLAAGSAERGHTTAIAYGVRPETPEDVRAAVPDDVGLYPVTDWGRRRLGVQLRAARELRATVEAFQPDVIHLHSSFAGFVGIHALRDYDIPLIFTPHAFASQVPERGRLSRRAYRMAERYICRQVDSVGAVSTSEADVARELGAQRVTCIFNGTSVTSDAERAPMDDPLVIAAGRTVAQRRPAETAAILSSLKTTSRVEWVGGGGGDRGRAGCDAINGTGIPMTGWLPHDEAIDRLAEANVYLHWTAWDGLPMTVLEAVSLGTVVIASDIRPNTELLGSDGVCSSKEEAVRLIRWLLENPDQLEAMAARQRARCKTFTCDTMIDGWLNDYRELLPPERVPAVVQTAFERSQLPRTAEVNVVERLEAEIGEPAARVSDSVPPPPPRRFVRRTEPREDGADAPAVRSWSRSTDEPEESGQPAPLK